MITKNQLRNSYNNHQYQNKAAFPRPELILLDLQLPKMSGLEVLEKIKSDRKLKYIPVVVISSSLRQDDIAPAYEAGVNSYISKPVNFDEFTTKIKQIKTYWFETNILPTVNADL